MYSDEATVWASIFHTGIPGFEFWFNFLFQLPANHLGRQQVMMQVVGSLPPTWETWIESQVPGLSLAQPWPLQPFEE